jgi:hypothetical protein
MGIQPITKMLKSIIVLRSPVLLIPSELDPTFHNGICTPNPRNPAGNIPGILEAGALFQRCSSVSIPDPTAHKMPYYPPAIAEVVINKHPCESVMNLSFVLFCCPGLNGSFVTATPVARDDLIVRRCGQT